MSCIGKPKRILPSDISNVLKHYTGFISSFLIKPFLGHVHCVAIVSNTQSTPVTLAFHLQSTFSSRGSINGPTTTARDPEDAQVSLSVSMLQAPLSQRPHPSHGAAIPKPWWVSGSWHTPANRDLFLQGRDIPSATKSLQLPIPLCSMSHRGHTAAAWSYLSVPLGDLSLAQTLITTTSRHSNH